MQRFNLFHDRPTPPSVLQIIQKTFLEKQNIKDQITITQESSWSETLQLASSIRLHWLSVRQSSILQRINQSDCLGWVLTEFQAQVKKFWSSTKSPFLCQTIQTFHNIKTSILQVKHIRNNLIKAGQNLQKVIKNIKRYSCEKLTYWAPLNKKRQKSVQIFISAAYSWFPVFDNNKSRRPDGCCCRNERRVSNRCVGLQLKYVFAGKNYSHYFGFGRLGSNTYEAFSNDVVGFN